MLKLFELSPIAINNIKGAEKKREYIVETMCKKIEELLGSFDEKQLAKEQAVEKSAKIEATKLAGIQAKIDQFEWLKLRATHDSLRTKLREIVIEKLTDVLTEQRSFLTAYLTSPYRT